MPMNITNIISHPSLTTFVRAFHGSAVEVPTPVKGATASIVPMVGFDDDRLYFRHESAEHELMVDAAGIAGDSLDLKIAFESAIRA